ncbi:MAG: AbgT family transporter [Planctomycetota bacterium]
MSDTQPSSAGTSTTKGGLLDAIEWVGNKLPDPVLLFLFGAMFVMVASQIAVSVGWEVQPKEAVISIDETTGEELVTFVDDTDKPPLTATSLLSADGLFWCVNSMVDNFMAFPPLGVVLVGMLGIGVAERTGLLAAVLKAFMLVVPNRLLTPTMVFLGIMSSMGVDAGYVVLPPLAAALYKSVGRSPLAGLAAVFAGVSAGFNANLFVTGLDPMLAEFSQVGARVVDENYAVAATCNWWFMIASTFVITFAGWLTTALFVERRLNRKSVEDGGPGALGEADVDSQRLNSDEKRGLAWGGVTMVGLVVLMIGLTLVPGSPLHDKTVPSLADEGGRLLADSFTGSVDLDAQPDPSLVIPGEGYYTDATRTVFVTDGGEALQVRSPQFARWVDAVTPLIFLGFIIPGLVYGVVLGSLRTSKDAARIMIESMAAMAPIIVLAFFAAQFIEYLDHSQLGRMLAFSGGQVLAEADLSPGMIILAFILMTMVFNLFVGSMSAKYAIFAPIFIPMLMFVGISPELTQAAYRIGDSTTNIITPLNAYLVIILVFMQKHAPKGGMGTLIAMMMPYTIVFTVVWCIMLLIWMQLGLDLGPAGPLSYTPAG